MEKITLSESINSAKISGKRWRARIIEGNRWGSSAYYPNEILERDGATVFTSGLPMYANHPKESESWERPERSINDMVGKLISDAVFEEDGLYADVEFYDSFLERINELHEDVGLSVRAFGLTEEAEMDGRFGPVLYALLGAESVDVVTKAGAGGKLTSIIESDRELAGRPIEQEGTQSMTDVTKEDFEALRTELVEAINGIPAALAEALKPEPVEGAEALAEAEAQAAAEAAAAAAAEVETEAEVEIDHAAVLAAVAEAELPAVVFNAVLADLKGGKTIAEAVKAQTDLREAFGASDSHIGTFLREGDQSQTTGLARAVQVLGK